METTSRFRLRSEAMAACSVTASRLLRISRPVPASRATYVKDGIISFLAEPVIPSTCQALCPHCLVLAAPGQLLLNQLNRSGKRIGKDRIFFSLNLE